MAETGKLYDPGEAADPTDGVDREVREIYRLNAARLFRYAVVLIRNQEGAQDALQEVFLRYFLARREGQRILNPRAWLFRVLRNHLLDVLKAASVKEEVGIEQLAQAPDPRQDPESSYGQRETLHWLWNLLAPRELECLRLWAEGLRYDEIAEIVSVRPGTVGATLARAHKKIRHAMPQGDRAKQWALAAFCDSAQGKPSAP